MKSPKLFVNYLVDIQVLFQLQHGGILNMVIFQLLVDMIGKQQFGEKCLPMFGIIFLNIPNMMVLQMLFHFAPGNLGFDQLLDHLMDVFQFLKEKLMTHEMFKKSQLIKTEFMDFHGLQLQIFRYYNKQRIQAQQQDQQQVVEIALQKSGIQKIRQKKYTNLSKSMQKLQEMSNGVLVLAQIMKRQLHVLKMVLLIYELLKRTKKLNNFISKFLPHFNQESVHENAVGVLLAINQQLVQETISVEFIKKTNKVSGSASGQQMNLEKFKKLEVFEIIMRKLQSLMLLFINSLHSELPSIIQLLAILNVKTCQNLFNLTHRSSSIFLI